MIIQNYSLFFNHFAISSSFRSVVLHISSHSQLLNAQYGEKFALIMKSLICFHRQKEWAWLVLLRIRIYLRYFRYFYYSSLSCLWWLAAKKVFFWQRGEKGTFLFKLTSVSSLIPISRQKTNIAFFLTKLQHCRRKEFVPPVWDGPTDADFITVARTTKKAEAKTNSARPDTDSVR